MPDEPQNTQLQPEAEPQTNSIPGINGPVQPNQQQVEPAAESNYVSPPSLSTPEPIQAPVQTIGPVIASFTPIPEPSQIQPAFEPKPVTDEPAAQPQENIVTKTSLFKNKKVIIGVVVLAVLVVIFAAMLFLISVK